MSKTIFSTMWSSLETRVSFVCINIQINANKIQHIIYSFSSISVFSFLFCCKQTNTDILNTVDLPEVKSVWIRFPGIKMVDIAVSVEN